MNRARWEMWKVATGDVKASIFAELVADNGPLAEEFAAKFLKRTRCHTPPLMEDVFQAARIGIMLAIHKWDPAKGAFSTIAFFEARREMQTVIRDAKPISTDFRTYLPKAKQDAAAAFYAKHGRDPEPAEIGVAPCVVARSEKANATYVPLSEADSVAAETDASPEETLDRARDIRALKTFLRRLSPSDRAAFWSGKRPDLEAAAKSYVERRREGVRRVPCAG